MTLGFTADILLSWLWLILLGISSKLMGTSGQNQNTYIVFFQSVQSDYGSPSGFKIQILYILLHLKWGICREFCLFSFSPLPYVALFPVGAEFFVANIDTSRKHDIIKAKASEMKN